jgi:hypothetical protein
MKSLILALVLICISSTAQAYPCWMIRQVVAAYGIAAVEAWARSHGANEKTIEVHRKCLRS